MSQIFVNLPVPAANGIGTAVDVSSFGPLKSIAVSGGASCITVVEMSNDPGGLFWSPIWVFPVGGGEKNFNLACRWMRATIQQYQTGTPAVDVGGTNEGASFAQLNVPAGNGAGAALDVSLLGLYKTIQIGGDFTGSLQLEVSEDGVSNWATVASFQRPGAQNLLMAAHHARIRRNGVNPLAPGLPLVYMGATDIISGDRGVAISAGTQSAGTGTVVLSNANGVTFGMSGSSVVTASVAAIKSISAGGSSVAAGTVVFSNSNAISFGMSGSTVTASAYMPPINRVVGFTATGGETQFTVTFAPAAAATNYSVFGQANGVSQIPVLDIPAGSASRSVSAFGVVPSASLISGDQFAFFLFASS